MFGKRTRIRVWLRLLRIWWSHAKTVLIGLPVSTLILFEAVVFGLHGIWQLFIVVLATLFLFVSAIGYFMIFGPIPKRKIISYEQQKAKISKWLYSHRKTGLRFRMKDIMRYSDENIRKKDGTLLKHTTRTPPVLVDAETVFKIVADLHKRELLELRLSANKVEEFEVNFDGQDAQWLQIRVFSPNDLLYEPLRFVKEKFVWFILTLFSSLISVYSRAILEYINVI